MCSSVFQLLFFFVTNMKKYVQTRAKYAERRKIRIKYNWFAAAIDKFMNEMTNVKSRICTLARFCVCVVSRKSRPIVESKLS